MNRRGFLRGLAGILSAGVAPAVLPSGVLMPIRKLWVPEPVHVMEFMASAVQIATSWFHISIQDGDGRIWQHAYSTELPGPGDVVHVAKIPEGSRILSVKVVS